MKALYDKGREAFLGGDLAWDTDNIKVSLVDEADYTVNLATDQFYDDIPGSAIVSTSGNLTGKTITNGVADADDVTLSGVTGDESEILVIWQDTSNPATSRLICFLDAADVVGLPLTPNGGDVNIIWDNGSNKIFKL